MSSGIKIRILNTNYSTYSPNLAFSRHQIISINDVVNVSVVRISVFMKHKVDMQNIIIVHQSVFCFLR